MKRLILQVPDDYVVGKHVFAECTRPMPGTVEAGGKIIIDALADDDFDPSVIPGLGMDWAIVGLWQWDGAGELVTLVPLDEAALLAHLPPIVEYDDEGNEVSSTPQTEARIPANWSGWPVPT